MRPRVRDRLRDRDRQKFFVTFLAGKLVGLALFFLAVTRLAPWAIGKVAGAANIEQVDPAQITGIVNGVNTAWVLVAAFLVFFMQAGFMMLEAGFARTREVVNVLQERPRWSRRSSRPARAPTRSVTARVWTTPIGTLVRVRTGSSTTSSATDSSRSTPARSAYPEEPAGLQLVERPSNAGIVVGRGVAAVQRPLAPSAWCELVDDRVPERGRRRARRMTSQSLARPRQRLVE